MITAAFCQWKQAVAQNFMRCNATKHVTFLGNYSWWGRINSTRSPFLVRSITHDIRDKKSKKKDTGRQSYRFVDRTRVRVAGGTGGKASVSMFRMYRKMHRRPDGGHGGNGGSVVIVADPTEQTLRWTRPHVMAECGANGSSQDKNGRHGKNLVIRVPCGVVVRRILEYDEEWDEETKMVRKITAENARNNEGSWDDEDQEEGLFLAARGNDDDEDDSDDEDASDSDGDSESGSDDDDDDDDDDSNETENKSREPPRQEVKKVEMGDDGYFLNSDGLWELDKDYEDDSYSPNDMERMAAFVPWGDREKVILADLDQPGSYVVVALGGKGGIGSSLYKGRNGLLPSPHIMARNATPQLGEMAALELELKLIADVGLVGFPNAGKSSLLAAMSRATPHIAPYPFTTLHPLVGYIEYRDGFKVCAADVPGLIAGASEGRGKGHDFLRHLERTKALLFIVDAAGVDGRDPISDLRILADELSAYGDGGMMDRNSLICANKMDLIKDESQRKEIMLGLSSVAEASGIRLQGDILGISAGVSGEGLSTLSEAIRNIVKQTEVERRKTWEGDEVRD
jgi:GTPase